MARRSLLFLMSGLWLLVAAPSLAFNPLSALSGSGGSTEQKIPTQMTLKTDVGDAFKGAEKVVIGGFKVGFVDYRYAAAQAKGSFLGGGTFGGKSSARIWLKGISDADRQKITDMAYANFVEALKKAGYQVVDRKVLEAASGYGDVPGYAVPYRDDPMGSNTEISLFVPSNFGKVQFFLADGGLGVAVPFSTKSMNVIAAEFANKHPDTKVLAVNFLIDFAATENYAGRSYANVGVSDILSVLHGSSVWIYGGWGGTFSKDNGSIHATSGMVSTDPFGEVAEVTPEINSQVETAVNVISAFAGMGTNVSRHYEVKADPDRYTQVSETLLQAAGAQFIEKMVALR